MSTFARRMRRLGGLIRGPTALAILSVGVAFAIGVSPVGRVVDGLLADTLLALTPGGERSAVLIITLPPERTDDGAHLLALVANARAAGAERIGISGLAAQPEPSLLEALAEQDVVVGRPLDEDRSRVRPWPMTDVPPRWGVSTFEVASGGVVRSARTRFPLADGLAPAFGVALAKRSVADAIDPLPLDFRTEGALPSLTDTQALSGNLIPELVRDRAVIIGPGRAGDMTGASTPLAPAVSATRLHAHVTDTLLRDAQVQTPNLLLRLVLLCALAAGLSFVVGRRLGQSKWLVGTTLVLIPLAAIGARAGIGLTLPLTELLLLPLVFAALAMHRRILAQEEALREMISDSSHRLRLRVPNASFLDSPEHWQQIISLVDQTLELRRTLFLEREEDTNRVREIIARRCSIDDVIERRRDYERDPFRTAIAQRSPLRLNEPFLREEENEVQYIVPLVHSGNVLGFWALAIDAEQHPDRSEFEAALAAFAEQIADMLDLRARWQAEARADARGSATRIEQSAHGDLKRTIASIERRLEIFEDVFASQQTSMIVFDLFGQVVQTNSAMEALLEGISFTVESGTALDLLGAVTGRDRDYCQGLLRVVMLQRRALSLSVTVPSVSASGDGRPCQLTIGPVAAREQQSFDAQQEVRPFELAGLMIELQDVSRAHRRTALKEGLIERIGFRLRGDAEAIVLATSLLEDETLDAEMRKEIIDTLVDRTQSATRVMDEVRGYLTAERSDQPESCYPLDSVGTLARLLEHSEAATAASAKRVRFELEKPAYPHLVLAEDDGLSGLLNAIVNLLVADAAEGTVVRVIIQESEDRQTLRFFDEGFGIPNDRFQHYLTDADASTSEEYERLREARTLIAAWGGEFSAHADVGTGFEFKITFAIAI